MTVHRFQHEAMVTYFEVAIADEDYNYAKQVATAAFRQLDRLESELSRFIETSDIARANRLPRGASALLSEDAFECLLIAADVSIATQRAFGPGFASVRPPELAADLPPFTLDPATHTVTSHVDRLRLDLGAVGKGYALDRMAATLREWGISNACLNSGGSSLLTISPPDDPESGWSAGLGEGRGYREINLHNASLSGSGIAVKGAHVINPRSGETALRTTRVWALAPGAAQADALSTAFFVMNEAEIAALCTAHPAIGAALAAPGEELIVHGALRPLLEAAANS